ncbi:hypothetical protein E7Z59_13980 [Robertkochia marina]|uniref:Uncharacterized protein n=1 Tax=Robertkochia marina TaxID=1227945 RepID=A0A4S3LX01_9FLAO|nr:hypothetical protein [Robertkochia marina]THD65695.1 hypothetical protein E7Z59_13980 [Robertkochia marina]TRZ46621.1 hypothetical protein D3A96_03370 [Robertkochia marina]
MNKKIITYLLQGILFLMCFIPLAARADIVYPARLELREVDPGIFEVYFVLPVINGKVIKAAPVFPDFCSMLEEPQMSGNMYVKETRWRIQCEPQQLYGQSIGISGLLGSQVTIILIVTTLEGRTYNTTLNPAAAYYEIPPPPTTLNLFSQGILRGGSIPLSNLVFGLLIFTLILTRSFSRRNMVIILSSGIMIGYLLTYFEWLRIPGWLFEITALLLTCIMIIAKYLRQHVFINTDKVELPLTACVVFLGAEQATSFGTMGYTEGETGLMMIFTLTGIVLGVLLFYELIRQGLGLVALFNNEKTLPENAMISLTGIISIGLLIYQSSLLWNTPSLFPPIPVLLWIITLVMIAVLMMFAHRQNQIHILWILLPYFGGLIAGFTDLSFPYPAEVTLGLGMLCLIPVYFHAFRDPFLPRVLLAFLSFSSGVWLAMETDQNLSYPIARSLEFSLIALFAGGLLLPVMTGFFKTDKAEKSIQTSLKVLFAAVFLLIGVNFFFTSELRVHEPLTSPFLQIPLLSLALILLGVFFWPKRKKVHKDLGVTTRKPSTAFLMFALAFCFIGIRSAVQNPWFNTSNMDRQGAENVMQQILSNTYTAFNLEDEELLFETLSSNIDEDLLDNVYLDSRRRLTMGLREGAEVTVEDVSVAILGDAENSPAETTFSYPATWTVTARVKHLKHIHYRRNRYTGTIEMKTNNNSWKISKIILNSEEREVIPSATL